VRVYCKLILAYYLTHLVPICHIFIVKLIEQIAVTSHINHHPDRVQVYGDVKIYLLQTVLDQNPIRDRLYVAADAVNGTLQALIIILYVGSINQTVRTFTHRIHLFFAHRNLAKPPKKEFVMTVISMQSNVNGVGTGFDL
jgi:hypothetical protein